MIIDARGRVARVECDVAIAGAGPAGISLALIGCREPDPVLAGEHGEAIPGSGGVPGVSVTRSPLSQRRVDGV